MKYREKLGYIALGGFLMLASMLMEGVMLPLGAQDEKADLNVGQITCTGLTVASENRASVMLIGDKDGGFVHVFGEGGRVAIIGDENGGKVDVYFKDSRSIPEARLSADENGGFVHVGGFRDGQSAAVTLDPSGVRAR